MDDLTRHRKGRLHALIAAPPYNGSQNAFAEAASVSKAYISQLLGPETAFGERTGKNLANALRFDNERYFEVGYYLDSASPELPKTSSHWRRIANRMARLISEPGGKANPAAFLGVIDLAEHLIALDATDEEIDKEVRPYLRLVA